MASAGDLDWRLEYSHVCWICCGTNPEMMSAVPVDVRHHYVVTWSVQHTMWCDMYQTVDGSQKTVWSTISPARQTDRQNAEDCLCTYLVTANMGVGISANVDRVFNVWLLALWTLFCWLYVGLVLYYIATSQSFVRYVCKHVVVQLCFRWCTVQMSTVQDSAVQCSR